MYTFLIMEGMAQWLRRWTHDRKVIGSIPGPDCVCVLEQDTLFHIVPVHSVENEYQLKLGVNLAIDQRPIQEMSIIKFCNSW